MRACLITTGASHWPKLTLKLAELGVEPVMWFSPTYYEHVAQENFPQCKRYPYLELTRGESLKKQNFDHAPPAAFFTSKDFLRLKDQVYKAMDRQDDFGLYRRLEREAVFYSLFMYFYSELKGHGVEFLLAPEGCHEPVTITLYGVAQMMGIECRHFDISMVAPIMVMRNGLNQERLKLGKRNQPHATRFKEILHNYVDSITEKSKQKGTEMPLYMVKQRISDSFVLKKLWYNTKDKPFTKKIAYIRKKISWLFKPYYTVKSTDFLEESQRPTVWQVWCHKRNRARLKRKLKENYLELALEEQPPLDTPYVYAPLHYEPERTTNPDGCEYYNQLDALASLRAFVPADIPIYIKEHYSQFTAKLHGNRGKSLYFYRVLANMHNVRLLPMGCNSLELSKHAQFTASLTGTASLESAILGKRALLFGQVWFTGCPNTFHFQEQKNYESFMKKPLKGTEAVKAFFDDLVDNYAVHGYVSHTNEPHFRELFPDEPEFMDTDIITQSIADALVASGLLKGKASKLRKAAS